jgi:hypothetical protein
MSEPDQVAAPPEVRSRWRLWRVLLGVVLAAVVVLAGLAVYQHVGASRDLDAALAEADRLDPNWREGELEAGRTVIPDRDNAALLALAVKPLLPAGWPIWDQLKSAVVPTTVADSRRAFRDSLVALPAPVQLSAAQTEALRKELGRAAAALAEARKLKDLPRGRYFPAAANPWGPQPHWDLVHDLGQLLVWDGWLHAQDGDLAAALASVHAALNAGRSLGDEPGAFPHITRLECRTNVLHLLERVLAQGEAPPAALETLQRALAVEAEDPVLLAGLRGYRAVLDRSLEWVQNRTIPRSVMEKRLGLRSSGGTISDVAAVVAPGTVKRQRADVLAYLTRCVEIAKLPAEQQQARFAALNREFVNGSGLVPVMVATCEDRAGSDLSSRAQLRCAAAALAVERYRQEHQRWPETLAALVPRFLSAVPADPFDGQPLHLSRVNDGVVVYCARHDGMTSAGSEVPDMLVGFRLWDVAKRRQPPRAGTPDLPPADQ